MDVWETREKHTKHGDREIHMVKICIIRADFKYIYEGLAKLRDNHNVPADAFIRISNGWNTWIEARWIVAKEKR